MTPYGRLVLFTYSTLLRLAAPLLLLRFWLRGRAEPLYREHLAERFGLYRGRKSAGWIWVHAVSLGETRAAAALVEALRVARPGMRLLLTHGTATGRDAGADLLRGGDVQVWLPVDMPGAVRRFLAHFCPSIGVLMETELWPNLLRAAQRRQLPMVVANARLSERSQRRGVRFDAVLRPLGGTLAAVLAQTDADAARLRESGAANVATFGNLKFDLAPDADLIERGQTWRARAGRPVLLAAVTRDGEETMVLAAWTRLAEPRPLLVIVPRHPQRFDHVAGYIDVAGLSFARRSAWRNEPLAPAFAVDAWVGDSMREMPLYYGFADVALLGGSFAPFGGQNLIEAAACGCPVVMGPHTFNFAEAAAGALEAGAALRVPDMAAGVDAALALLADPERLAATREAALGFSQRHRGAAERMAERIVALLPRL